jgi:hypothetical protein
MRIAAIYDIHANLPALEAVLRDICQYKYESCAVAFFTGCVVILGAHRGGFACGICSGIIRFVMA